VPTTTPTIKLSAYLERQPSISRNNWWGNGTAENATAVIVGLEPSHTLACTGCHLERHSAFLCCNTIPPVYPRELEQAILFFLPPTWDLNKHTLQAYRPYSRSCAFGIANIPHTTHSRLEIYAPEEIRNTPQTTSSILPRVPLGIGQHGSDTLRARRRQGNCLPMLAPAPALCASCCLSRQRSPASNCKGARISSNTKADTCPHRNRKTAMASHSSSVSPRCRAGGSAWRTRMLPCSTTQVKTARPPRPTSDLPSSVYTTDTAVTR
jgi:hypothetical protein